MLPRCPPGVSQPQRTQWADRKLRTTLCRWRFDAQMNAPMTPIEIRVTTATSARAPVPVPERGVRNTRPPRVAAPDRFLNLACGRIARAGAGAGLGCVTQDRQGPGACGVVSIARAKSAAPFAFRAAAAARGVPEHHSTTRSRGGIIDAFSTQWQCGGLGPGADSATGSPASPSNRPRCIWPHTYTPAGIPLPGLAADE